MVCLPKAQNSTWSVQPLFLTLRWSWASSDDILFQVPEKDTSLSKPPSMHLSTPAPPSLQTVQLLHQSAELSPHVLLPEWYSPSLNILYSYQGVYAEAMRNEVDFLRIHLTGYLDGMCIFSGEIWIHGQLHQLLLLPLSWFAWLALPATRYLAPSILVGIGPALHTITPSILAFHSFKYYGNSSLFLFVGWWRVQGVFTLGAWWVRVGCRRRSKINLGRVRHFPKPFLMSSLGIIILLTT